MIKVFLSYAHKDEALQKELSEHLGALKHEKIIDTWFDRQISPGDNWSEEIARQLEEADLILLLVSSAFLDSTYCYEKEMRRAIERHEAGAARVIPICLRPCHWDPAPFAKLQGLPENMRPVTSLPQDERDAVWTEVAKGIHRAAASCVALRGSATSKQVRASDVRNNRTISLTSFVSVDEEELDSTIESFGFNWPEVGIKWDRSCDQFLLLVREAVKKFGDDFTRGAKEAFIKAAPARIASTVRNRAIFQKRLPGLVSRMRKFDTGENTEFGRECTREAIKGFLLLANFKSHQDLALINGIQHLNLPVPKVCIEFLVMPSKDFLRRLHGESDDILHERLYKIGDYDIDRGSGGPPFMYVYVPKWLINTRPSPTISRRESRLFQDQLDICKWLIPQIETSDELRSLPETYAGYWYSVAR